VHVKHAALAFAALAFAVPSIARADGRTAKACVAAADRGQTLRDKGKLSDAKKAFVECSRDACPGMVARQCVTWLQGVERDMPTVTFRARDGQNHDLVDVGVSVDGAVLASSLDGRPVSLDPGVHTIRYTHAGDPDVEQQVVIRSGEKDRILDVRFGASAPVATATVATPATTSSSSSGEEKTGFRFPVFAGISLGVGVASFVGMAVLVATAASDVNTMRATCAGSCSQSDVDWANTRIILANVAMGVGIAGIGASVLSLVIANVGGHGHSKAAWQIDVGPGTLGLTHVF
jgi:hypothetical protein